MESIFEYSFEATKDGFFYIDFDFIVGNYTISINDGAEKTGSCGRDPLKNVGYVKKGDTIYLKVVISGYGVALYGADGYIIDDTVVARAYDKLSQNVLDVTYASDTKIKGTISLKGDSVLYSSIPAEAGWSVWVDGVKQETFALDGVLLCADIKAGDHTVEYRYQAPGLAAGIGISVVGAAALAAYYLFVYLYRNRKSNGAAKEKAE